MVPIPSPLPIPTSIMERTGTHNKQTQLSWAVCLFSHKFIERVQTKKDAASVDHTDECVSLQIPHEMA